MTTNSRRKSSKTSIGNDDAPISNSMTDSKETQRWRCSSSHMSPDTVASLQACGLALCAYFCVYGTRVPALVPTYEGEEILGLDLKTVLGLADVLGYMTGKIPSVLYYPALDKPYWRNHLICQAMLSALLLITFPLLPNWGLFVGLFLSSIARAPMWGILLRYLEGRQLSDISFCVFNFSYIIAGGIVRSLSAAVLDWGVPERWMPFLVGMVLTGGLSSSFIILLDRVPMPSKADIAERSTRDSVTFRQQLKFVSAWWPGVLGMGAVYSLATSYRVYRDIFTPEIWSALPGDFTSDVYAQNDILVGSVVLVVLSLVTFIRSSTKALYTLIFAFMLPGVVLIFFGTLWVDVGDLGGFAFMTLIGTGIYLIYIPSSSLIFERLMAAIRGTITISFIVSFYDAAGLAATASLLIYQAVGADSDRTPQAYLDFYISFGYYAAVAGACLIIASGIFFVIAVRRHQRRLRDPLKESLNTAEGDSQLEHTVATLEDEGVKHNKGGACLIIASGIFFVIAVRRHQRRLRDPLKESLNTLGGDSHFEDSVATFEEEDGVYNEEKSPLLTGTYRAPTPAS